MMWFCARFNAILDLPTRKHAVETVEMLDFLKEIVEPVPDPSAGGTINLDAEDNNGGTEPKKRRAPKGKKPAAGEEDDGSDYIRVVRDELLIEIRKPEERADAFDRQGGLPIFDGR